MKNCYSAFDPPPTYRSELAVEQAEQRASDASTIATLREHLAGEEALRGHAVADLVKVAAERNSLQEQLAEARGQLAMFAQYHNLASQALSAAATRFNGRPSSWAKADESALGFIDSMMGQLDDLDDRIRELDLVALSAHPSEPKGEGK